MRAVLGALAIVGLACGGDGGGNGPTTLAPSTTYRGIITANDGTTAGLVLTFDSAVNIRVMSDGGNAAVVVPVTGVATVSGGGTVDLTGMLDGTALSMTGGGYALTGSLSRGQFTGTFTGPGGLSGSFGALSSTEDTPAYAYCGTFSGTITPGNIPSDGGFNMVVAGKVVQGASVGDDGDLVVLNGSASAGSNGITVIAVNQTNAEGTVRVNGTITADKSTMSGTFQASAAGEVEVNNGTFQGALCPGPVP